MAKARAIFFGTPQFAVPCLDALAEICDVVAVVTQPDKPQGRGMALSAPPVKTRAHALGITEIIQPTKVRVPEFSAQIEALSADIALVVAYGRILVPGVLKAPRLGCVNVHASLLPKYRGAAPIQWSVIHGERESGVCLMQMDEGLDTGAVLSRRALPIGENETSGELSERLSALGAAIVRDDLPKVLRGELVAVPQDHASATHAPLLEKSLGRIDWSKDARSIHNLVRGTSPWPGAFTQLDGATVKIHATRVIAMDAAVAEHGAVIRSSRDEGIVVGTAGGALAITELQREGKRRMTAAEFLAGNPLSAGARFS